MFTKATFAQKVFTKLTFTAVAGYSAYKLQPYLSNMDLNRLNNPLIKLFHQNLTSPFIQQFFQVQIARCDDAHDNNLSRPYLGCSLRSMIDKEGMAILMVNTESPGWQAGLKVGDIVLEIDDQKVNNIKDYFAAIAKTSNKQKTFKILRNGEERLFIVNLM